MTLNACVAGSASGEKRGAPPSSPRKSGLLAAGERRDFLRTRPQCVGAVETRS